MSNAQRLIPFAFGAVIVLLAANLLSGTRRPAESDVTAGPTQPYVVSIAIGEKPLGPLPPGQNSEDRLYRLWSDGAVDLWSIWTLGTGEYGNNWWGWVPLDPISRADISGPGGVSDGCVDAFDLGALLADWCSVAGGNPCGTCGA